MFADRLEALLREATPGDWLAIRMSVYAHIKNVAGHYVAEPVSGKMQFRHFNDAELIALLRNHADALLEVVKAAKSLNDQAPIADAYPGSSLEASLYHLGQALRKLGVATCRS